MRKLLKILLLPITGLIWLLKKIFSGIKNLFKKIFKKKEEIKKYSVYELTENYLDLLEKKTNLKYTFQINYDNELIVNFSNEKIKSLKQNVKPKNEGEEKEK